MQTEVGAQGITFEKFLVVNYKYLRAGPESFDRMIFDIFDLETSQLIGERELCKMLLTLPPQAIISGLNSEIVVPQEALKAKTGFDYRVVRAPENYTTINRNKKLLMRVADQESDNKITFVEENKNESPRQIDPKAPQAVTTSQNSKRSKSMAFSADKGKIDRSKSKSINLSITTSF